MLLKCTDTQNAADEHDLRRWLVNNIGEEDQRALVEWVWENHRDGVKYVDALAHIVRETGTNGYAFLRNLLDFAKKPKEQREAEQEILAWLGPKYEKVKKILQLNNGNENVAKEEFEKLCEELQEKLYNMFPDKHRATMKGAMLTAFTHARGKLQFDIARLVQTLFMVDPLSSTSRFSR